MKRLHLGAALALFCGAGLSAAMADTEDHIVFATGAEPISHEEYDRLPKLGKFRAWLPKKVDLTPFFPKPGYQGQEPNCTAWATTYAARSFLYGKDIGHQPTGPAEQMSPAYVYNRLRPAGSQCDRAIRIVDALNLLQTEGVVNLQDFPDDLRSCPIPAPTSLREKAGAFKLAGWRAIDRETPGDWRTPVILDDIKGALSRGQPVVFGMPVQQDFMDYRGPKRPEIYTHQTPETKNFHAMALIGYDEDKQAFRLINSWGDSWGDHGYGWISYDSFKLLAGEAYALDNGPPKGAPAPILPPAEAFDQLLAKMPCASVKVVKTGGHLIVSGFAGSQASIAELHNAALAVDPRADWNVAWNGWPQCEAQSTLAGPLAIGTVTLSAQYENGLPRTGNPVVLQAGEKFGISAETSAKRPYLSVVYLQKDGSAVELYRGMPAPDAHHRRVIALGTGGPGQVRFQVGPPYGDEILIALASTKPLFGQEMEGYATERQFLTDLRAKLAAAPPASVAAATLRLRSHE